MVRQLIWKVLTCIPGPRSFWSMFWHFVCPLSLLVVPWSPKTVVILRCAINSLENPISSSKKRLCWKWDTLIMIFDLIFVNFAILESQPLVSTKNGWLLVNEFGGSYLLRRWRLQRLHAKKWCGSSEMPNELCWRRQTRRKKMKKMEAWLAWLPPNALKACLAWHIFILSIRFWWRQRIGFKRGIREMATLLALGLIGSELRKHNRAVDEERRWGSKRKGRGVVFKKCI